MKKLLGGLLIVVTGLHLFGCQSQNTSYNSVPSPSKMEAVVEVDGRLSKLITMDIKHVGKTIPYTYSHNKIANSPGYEWWVSKHFAIKSDLPENKVKLYLELLELSYPHYVSLFGAEPVNIGNQRIAVVYGSSRDSTKETMFDDGFTRGVHKHAGGETMYYNRAGYSFPSHREQHQRYIVIHETMHAYHMALTGHSTWAPNWITEGLADSIASHVYYPETDELAVMVFDRAPMNYIASGLRQYVKGGQPSIEKINNDPALKRGLNFFIVHFLLSDPERAFYFSLFRDRLMEANPHSGDTLPTANKLLKDTFPDWQKLEKEFKEYVAMIEASFFIAQGPWEQNGDAYWIRGHKNDYVPRLDIRNLQSSSQTVRFDFPQPEASSLITNTDAHFKAGVLVNFEPEQISRGQVGFALGLQYHDENKNYFKTYENKYSAKKDAFLAINLHQGRKLTVSGQNLEFSEQSFALSEPLVKEIKSKNQVGISANLAPQSLNLTLASGLEKQQIQIPITNALEQQLNTSHMALLAANARHKLIPYFAGQPDEKTYFAKVDEKQWTSNGALYRIFRTCVEFNLNCDAKLTDTINGLKLDDEKRVSRAIERLLTQTIDLTDQNQAALTMLSGAKLNLVSNLDDIKLEVRVPQDTAINIDNQFTWLQGEQEVESFNQLKTFNSGVEQLHVRMNKNADKLKLNSNLNWKGRTIELTQSIKTQVFDGVYLTSNLTKDNGQVTVTANLTGPYSGDTKGKIEFELLPNQQQSQGKQIQQVSIAPYEYKSWQQTFQLPAQSSQPLAIEITAKLVVDGEDILLSEFIYLN